MAKISEQEIAHILQQSLDLVLVLDPDDLTLLFVNEHGANWLGFSPDDLIGKSPLQFMPELTQAELEVIIENLRFLDEGDGSVLVTPVHRHLGIDHDFEFRLQLIDVNGRHFILASGRDIAERVAVTDQVHNLLADAQIESRQDKTTQLYQRDAFLQVFRELLEQVGPNGLRLGLVAIDMKNLHEINDQFGQSVGDRVLRNMGSLLNHCVGRDDICARFSGRKLCILMPGKGQHDGLQLAEKISRALGKVKYAEFPTLRIHSCIGVAELPEPGEPELLLEKVISRMRDLKSADVAHEVHRLGLVSLQLP
ncbi:GGDEF domain-containing protein [Marinospirillum alkaliphilum]|uniref:PAS domain S-box-containing protein/diguanylate cyclase (GGDEF) domain-containing protein n=1 Tax=Marinospirillum alkaliphilum DSM 21637 TaxID=1122209 RepID=A0A1K1XPW0_9GAMM|nr:GGDEF domain-containing protein [Marinospirillum alkaliphilum]SFX51403.1 PAS domain S-box-containing protein/diguanylate cyclase (GGDEF) domain-containing protein [Marinospirillum alkaliphilum DSM 21637]